VRPRRLLLTDEALRDIVDRARVLRDARGAAFALDWTDALLDWLESRAAAGAQLGTEHPSDPSFRTFGYRRQATVLAEFTDDELRIVRIYFAGQDWSR
jgi:plasmid stabilization system protein ParE